MRRKEHIKQRRTLWATLAGLMLVGGLNTACTDYQDEADALDRRVTVLENLVDRVNSDISAIEVIAAALEDADYITGVKEQDGGYAINFAKAGPVFIKDGVDGLNGKDGLDADVPALDIAKGTDGNYYWVLDGAWLTGDNGEKIRANGKDGADGTDGADGKDGQDAKSPQVRINPDTGEWEISTDGGDTWTSTGTSAKGKDGKDGKDGRDGIDGEDGEDGEDAVPYFVSMVYEVYNGNEVMTVKLRSGQVFRIPIVSRSNG